MIIEKLIEADLEDLAEIAKVKKWRGSHLVGLYSATKEGKDLKLFQQFCEMLGVSDSMMQIELHGFISALFAHLS